MAGLAEVLAAITVVLLARVRDVDGLLGCLLLALRLFLGPCLRLGLSTSSRLCLRLGLRLGFCTCPLLLRTLLRKGLCRLLVNGNTYRYEYVFALGERPCLAGCGEDGLALREDALVDGEGVGARLVAAEGVGGSQEWPELSP